YAAATTLRGVRWAVVSTTLLGMVDASIGGKTSINHSDGKNLIGAFWQPSLVWCDTRFLMTLPEREMMSGLGEVLKYGGLVGKPIVGGFEKLIRSGDIYATKQLERLIVSSARYKASIVSADENDTGKRMVLNLGHTFGHAIERGAGYGRLSHGEAVVIGLKAACYLSIMTGKAGKTSLNHYQEIIDAYIVGIPRRKIHLNKVFDAMALDKKRSGRRQKYILLKGLGKPIIATEIENKMVRESLLHALTGFEFVGEADG
ncbi:MAG: 3-dehydroquinate synthase family protein, partial [candidate division Zixibacteria bacterium]